MYRNDDDVVWTYVVEDMDFVDVREVVEETLIEEYPLIERDRVVASTVIFPLKYHMFSEEDYRRLQVWVIPRSGRKIRIKVILKEMSKVSAYNKQLEKSFERITTLLEETWGLVKS